MRPTLIRQSKPAGRVTGSIERPMDAAMLDSIPGGAVDPGIGMVTNTQSTAEAAMIAVPTSRVKRFAVRHAFRTTTLACGTRYDGISRTSGRPFPFVTVLRRTSDAA